MGTDMGITCSSRMERVHALLKASRVISASLRGSQAVNIERRRNMTQARDNTQNPIEELEELEQQLAEKLQTADILRSLTEKQKRLQAYMPEPKRIKMTSRQQWNIGNH